ncbi:uncharacterized protein H6S33_004175 [Morchella sextelata]|uniref:uncharacterized protein n=1 Tax=Morchella sextelata TaxID=1174677 RepID=UPI001D05A419|nr:uncharacterized protein H6S33_004175 [Morchella sextelata]KAH0605718.1 hypothetical protein H6S33_004175 [Morchella sextelata]
MTEMYHVTVGKTAIFDTADVLRKTELAPPAVTPEEIPIDPLLLSDDSDEATENENQSSSPEPSSNDSQYSSASNNIEQRIMEEKLDRIQWKYGEKIHGAVIYAMEKKYPLLSDIIERTKELVIEERLRQHENIIKRTIKNYQQLDFYQEFINRRRRRKNGPSVSAKRTFEQNKSIPLLMEITPVAFWVGHSGQFRRQMEIEGDQNEDPEILFRSYDEALEVLRDPIAQEYGSFIDVDMLLTDLEGLVYKSPPPQQQSTKRGRQLRKN